MANQNELKYIMDHINNNSENEKHRVKEDLEKYLIFNGHLRKKLREIIMSEFKDPDTITELTNRIVPINITSKIIKKLAKVYNNGANRKPVVEDDNDQELIEMYSKSFAINKLMNFCNQMTKLTKHSLIEPYLDNQGIPKIRILPSHTFSVYSNDMINPERMTSVIKHIDTSSMEKSMQVFAYWDKETHWLIDGEGNILHERMKMLENEEGINPYGELPFIHVNQQFELLYPIRSNDIMSVQYAVCLLLSDSTLAQKYLSWATLLLTGVDGDQKVVVGPKAILSLPKSVDGQNPDAKYIQPNLNSDEVIRLVEKLIEFVLTTNNLSAGSVVGNLSTQNAESGISKMFDSLESTEDINEQRQVYIEAEQKLWDLFSHSMLPVWVESKDINPEYTGAFSPDFELAITFPDIKPLMTKKERIENARLELMTGTTSLKRAIKEINPDMEAKEIEDLILEIMGERVETNKFFERNLVEPQESGN
jgi:hypothetical protein